MDERKRIKNGIRWGGHIHLNGWIVKTFTKIEQALGITELSGKKEARINGFHFLDLHKRCPLNN